MSKLLTLGECARRSSTSERLWRKLTFEHKIPVVRIGRLVRIDERDFEAFIAANREEPRQVDVTPIRGIGGGGG